ncbi:hypothetical protein Y032_0079g1248 [Ancylostoma ceylanicum]|uniref:Uncharacterized protein n=1 Tax=Ancylostoma ceylanicum TaxID=53326 RepID=A0A016TTC3_9BILA|nr:hypothetical protein Y032_0079g1248 [Ancylostoma ceylanicum]
MMQPGKRIKRKKQIRESRSNLLIACYDQNLFVENLLGRWVNSISDVLLNQPAATGPVDQLIHGWMLKTTTGLRSTTPLP